VSLKFDLFDNPIPENHGKPGANGHTPDAETTSKIRTLLVAGKGKKEIAEELGLSMPTLTKHYFHSGRVKVRDARKKALADQKAKTIMRLNQAVDKGNVTAMRTMLSIIEEEEREMLRTYIDTVAAPTKEKPMPAGKKDKLAANAELAIENNPLLNPEIIH